MKLGFFLLGVFVTAVVVSPTAESSSVRVPQDVATIQSALEGIADTVLVAAGTYPERLTLSRDVVVLGPDVGSGDPPAAVVLGATITFSDNPGEYTVMLRRIRWVGRVAFGAPGRTAVTTFVSCWFDSGATAPLVDDHFVAFRECRLYGSIMGGFQYLGVSDCRFERAGIDVFAGSPVITRNVIEGPAPHGIAVRGPPSYNWAIRDNQVRKVGVGISMNDAIPGVIERNLIEDCEDIGIRVTHARESRVRHNQVRRCKGAGIVQSGLSFCDSNLVERCGGDGIVGDGWFRGNQVQHVGGYGIYNHSFAAELIGNVVLHARRDGVFANDALLEASRNVVGFCGGHGFNAKAIASMTRNTLFDNRGSGALVRSTLMGPAIIRANIAASNRGCGLEYAGAPTDAWELACNDWFRNGAGATRGVPTSSSDVSVDPRFCGRGHGDVRLSDSSPLASIACGPVGARDIGCGEASNPGEGEIVAEPDPTIRRQAVGSESAPRVLLAAGTPEHPSLVLSLAKRTEMVVTAYDIQGRTVAKLASGVFESGLHEFRLQTDALARLGSGIYFVRVRWPGGSTTTRWVVRR